MLVFHQPSQVSFITRANHAGLAVFLFDPEYLIEGHLIDHVRRVSGQRNLGRRDVAVRHFLLNLPQQRDEGFEKPGMKVILGLFNSRNKVPPRSSGAQTSERKAINANSPSDIWTTGVGRARACSSDAR